VDVLAGFRYLDLDEAINLQVDIERPTPAGTARTSGVDDFGAHSQFYGGQVGARMSRRWQSLSASITGKLALGDSHQTVQISGNRTQTNPGAAPVITPGFVFSEPTNIGEQSSDAFAVVPEVQLRLAYDLTRHITASFGYDFLYWSQVVRPGNQIDRVVNPTQRAGGTLVGPARPAPRFDSSDFWMQALNVGVQLRY
jgi:hypothetical protein